MEDKEILILTPSVADPVPTLNFWLALWRGLPYKATATTGHIPVSPISEKLPEGSEGYEL